MTTCARSASAALRVCTIGYFQPDKGQFGCISCDILGDFYQELSAQSSCVACRPNTQRFVGVLNAATQSSCQCKEGDVTDVFEELALLSVVWWFVGLRLFALQATSIERADPERYDALRSVCRYNELSAFVHWHLTLFRLRFHASHKSLDIGPSFCRHARSVLRAPLAVP